MSEAMERWLNVSGRDVSLYQEVGIGAMEYSFQMENQIVALKAPLLGKRISWYKLGSSAEDMKAT